MHADKVRIKRKMLLRYLLKWFANVATDIRLLLAVGHVVCVATKLPVLKVQSVMVFERRQHRARNRHRYCSVSVCLSVCVTPGP